MVDWEDGDFVLQDGRKPALMLLSFFSLGFCVRIMFAYNIDWLIDRLLDLSSRVGFSRYNVWKSVLWPHLKWFFVCLGLCLNNWIWMYCAGLLALAETTCWWQISQRQFTVYSCITPHYLRWRTEMIAAVDGRILFGLETCAVSQVFTNNNNNKDNAWFISYFCLYSFVVNTLFSCE